MAYKDFSEAYLKWLQSQLDYIEGKPYANFIVSIDPTYEVTSFKQAIDVNQQKIFHNAADDQVAHLRSMKEISKTPSDYMAEYEAYLKLEMGLIQSATSEIDNTHEVQKASDNSTMLFYSTFAPKALAEVGKYNPMRIFT